MSKAYQTSKSSNVGIFCIILVYRIINALTIQTQFDPDEYWQTLEPAYCLAFPSENNCAYTWEWTRRRNLESRDLTNIGWIEDALHGPIRSYVPTLPTYFLYSLLRAFHLDTTWSVARAPLILNAAIVAAPTDFGVFYISRYIRKIKGIQGSEFPWKYEHFALLASITNWFNGFALVRTYSNSMESSLLCIGVALLCPELFGDVHSKSDLKVRPIARLAFFLGGISVVIRFTALASYIPLGIIICLRRKSLSSKMYYLWHICVLSGATGVALGCIVDRFFYGFWGIPFLGSFHFNVLLGNGSLYGTHPWYWYIIAGLPAIAGILVPLFIFQCLSCFRNKNKSRVLDDPQSILLIVISVYIVFHSISAHKEFRFILPILSLVSILAGHTLNIMIHTKNPYFAISHRQRFAVLTCMTIFLNYPHLLYLCIMHQRAPIQVNKIISNVFTNVDKMQIKGKSPMTVHYLMGCHSAPLYSHLHIRGRQNEAIPIESWHLDCSPDCRSDPHSQCESDKFTTDPMEFVEDAYRHSQANYCAALDKSCGMNGAPVTSTQRQVPDVLAIFEDNLNRADLRGLLVAIGLKEFKAIRHSLKRVSVVRHGPDFGARIEELVFWIPGSGLGLKFQFEHMIIFTSLDHSLISQ